MKIKTSLVMAALLTIVGVGIMLSCRMSFLGGGPPVMVSSKSDLPYPLQRLFKTMPDLADAVQIYDHPTWLATKCILRVHGQGELIDELISQQSLEDAPTSHPKMGQLLRSLPDVWSPPDLSKCKVYASAKYGTTHQEGVDLFLLVRNEETETTLVLYEWIF